MNEITNNISKLLTDFKDGRISGNTDMIARHVLLHIKMVLEEKGILTNELKEWFNDES